MEDLKKTLKMLQFTTIADYKKRVTALELKLHQTQQMLQFGRSDRNILSKNLHSANVIYAVLLLNKHVAI